VAAQTLPTVEEYRDVGRALSDVYSDAKYLLVRVEEIVRADEWPCDELPTEADLGALWAFGDELRVQAGLFSELVTWVVALLPPMDEARGDAVVTRRKGLSPAEVDDVVDFIHDLTERMDVVVAKLDDMEIRPKPKPRAVKVCEREEGDDA
jgi:hypothetical protein